MAKYTGTILTNKGKELLARAILGEVIIFTKVEIGKGIVSPGTNKENLTSLVDSFKILSITSTSKLPNGGYRIRISFNNKGFIDDTYLREVGVYARGEDGTEILYSYCDTVTPNLIPNEPSGIIESVEDIITYISSAGTINAVIDQSNVYATIKDLVEGLATKENTFNKNGAFNKSFGSISGTVMEGNKRATDLGGEAAFSKKDAFNRSFSHVISSTSKILIASAYAVKTAYDKGATALTKATTAQNTANSAQTKANQAYSLASEKEPKFTKNSGFNKEKTDSVTANSSVILATAKAVKTAYDKGTEGLNKANAALTLNQAKGLFVGKETKQYNNSSLDNDANDSEYGWFTILKGVTDGVSPLTVTIHSGAHYSTKFIVGGNYLGHNCKVTVLFNNSREGNNLYSNLRGVRASSDGTVQVKMSPRGIVAWTIGIESSIGDTELKHLENRLVRNDSKTAITSEVDLSNDLYECKYDVGDYWITESTANPATKWTGSTWTKLEGRVLLGTSSGYALGSQGGTSTHTLTLAEMVRHRHLVDSHIHTKNIHNHYVNGQNLVLGRAGRDGTFDARSSIALSNDASYYPMDGAGGENTGASAPYTNYQGNGSAFNIMNPYRVVNIWRRTA